MVLTVSSVLSLVNRAFLPPSPRNAGVSGPKGRHRHCRELISASGYQDHTASPYAKRRFAQRETTLDAIRIHRIPRPTCRDDRDTPLFMGREMAWKVRVILAARKAIYFLCKDWTIDSALIGFWKLDFWRNASSVIPGRIEDASPESMVPQGGGRNGLPGSLALLAPRNEKRGQTGPTASKRREHGVTDPPT
jgi:hypothetical protein